MGSKPDLRLAIIFKPAILNGLMAALTYIVKHDPGIPHRAPYGKPDIIGTTIGGQPRTPAGITHIAKIA